MNDKNEKQITFIIERGNDSTMKGDDLNESKMVVALQVIKNI